MDKASEWAAAPTWPRRDLLWEKHLPLNARPVLYPSEMTVEICCMGKYVSMKPHEALSLARWIIDTFGDEPAR
jgi:hypothetical protein